MITGIRNIKQRKLNLVYPSKEPILYNVKDKKLIPINVRGTLNPVGLSSIPFAVRKSRFFTVSDLYKLSKLNSVPTKEEVISFMGLSSIPSNKDYQFYHRRSKKLIEHNELKDAFMMVLIPELVV